MSTQNHTREFFDLIKAIGETKSKQEEDKIIVKELATLKQHVNNTKVTLKLMKEYIVRVLYCEMLGHDASFGYFYAIKLTSSKNLLEKRVGYLAVSLCIPKDHELLLLIIANLQRDLQSTNYLEVCCALSAATKLVNAETVPALADHVLKLKRHQNPAVRKKVIALLHTFHTLAPGGVPDILEHAKEALCDEPSVMGASLGLFYDMAQDPEYLPQLKELVPSFVHILKQIKDHKFPKDYDYHRLPAPWIQVRLFKILALLGKDDRVSSESMYDALREAMTRADIGINMGHALVYECVTTITSIYPSNLLLENAAAAISRFVTSSNHNLKYLGIRALTEIVKINPKYATQHQMVVIDCLEDPDETLKRRTLSLLYTMTNASNATTIVKKLLEFARKSLDSHMRKELVENINSLAEQFTPNIFWYIDTMNSLLEIGPEFVPPSGIQNMMSVISLGAGDDDEKDEEMRRYCVDTFFEILDTKSVVHDLHLHVIAWVLGEYGFKSEQYSQADILELLCDVADRQFEEEETRVWVVSAMMKLVAHTGGIPPPSVEAVLHKYKNSKNVDLQQRCYEFLSIINCCNDSNREQIMDTILPLDGSCIDVEVDESLVFLQEFVDTATRGGAKTYVPHHMRQELEQQATKKQSELKYKEYAKPVTVPKTNMHEIFVTKETTPIELQQRSADTSHQEHSYYPSTYSTENTLNPTLLRDKARIWSDEDDTPAASTSSPFSYNPSPSVTSSFEPKTSPSFDNTFSLSKQDKPVDEPKKTGKNEKLRRDLFDGVGDLGGYKKSAARPRRNSKKIEKKAPVVQEEITPKSPDMWSEMSFRQDEPQTQQPQKLTLQEKIKLQKKQQQEQQQQVQPQPVVQQQSKTQNLLSFDDFFSEPSQPVTQQTQPTKQQASAEDFFLDAPVQQKQPELTSFDELLSPSTSATTTIKTQTIQPSTIRSQSNILISLAQEAQRGGQPVTLAQDELLEVVCEKFWREDTVVFALQFKTNRGYTLSSLLCQFQAPSKFNMRYQYDEYNSPNVRGNSITFPRLQPGDTVVLLVELQLADLAGFGTNLMGTINYADQNKRNKILSVTAPIDLIDVLRPASLQVSEFGQQWVSYSHENKIQVKGAFTLQSYSEKIQKLNVNVIQTIKVEAVAAARVIGHGDTYCLVHAKILSQGLAFTVKSKDKSLCEHLCRVALKVLV